MFKKVKKLLSCVLALSMISAMAVIPATAEGETTENTSLYLAYYSNDFESYTGKVFATTVTAGEESGWTKISNSNALLQYTNADGTFAISPYVAEGATGTGQSNWDYTFKEAITTGKVYISYDIMAENVGEDAKAEVTQARFTYTDDETQKATNKYLFYATAQDGQLFSRDNLSTTAAHLYDVAMVEGVYNRIDIIYDIEEKSVCYAVDGTVQAIDSLSASFPVETITFVMYPEYVIDNLKIAHRAGDTFEAEALNVESRSFDIKFSETVNKSLLTASNIVVKDADGNEIAVKSVRADYDCATVNLEEKLASEANYTVELKNITNVFGNTLATSNLSFKAPVTDYVLYEYDFENYTGGKLNSYDDAFVRFSGSKNPILNTNGSSKAMEFTGGNYFAYEFDKDITSGKIWVSYDVGMDLTAADEAVISGNIYVGYNPNEYASDLKTRAVDSYYTSDGTITHKTTKSISSTNENGASATGTFTENGVRNRIDWILDITNKTSTVYVDGVQLQQLTNCTIDNGATGVPTVRCIHWNTVNAGTVIDNIRIAYTDDESFTAEISSVGEDSFDIKLSESAKLTAENISVKDANGNSLEVASVDVKDYSRATVTMKNSFVSEASYKVTLTNVKNIVGTALQNTELSFTAPTIPERKTLLLLDTPEDFEALGLDNFEVYTEGDISGAKLNHSTTEVEGGYSSTFIKEGKESVSDNVYIDLKERAYAIGDITYEMKVFVEASTAVGATATSGVMFIPKLVADKGTSQLPYFNNQYYSYQNQTELIDGNHAFVSKTDQRGSWHTYKTVLHTDTKTADVYMDGTLINTYEFNNYNGLAASGYYKQLRFDYNVGGVNDGLVYENIPYVLIDYIKVTQEYIPNETGLYVLLNEVQEYGAISNSRNAWFKATGISAGEELRTVAYVLNLTGETISGYSLGAVYNDGQMVASNGSEITAENGEVFGGEVNLTVEDVENMEIKGFLWDSELSPLTDAAVADSTIAEAVTE